MRGGKVVERVELVTGATSPAPRQSRPCRERERGDVLQAAVEQFYAERDRAVGGAPPVAVRRVGHRAAEAWLTGGPITGAARRAQARREAGTPRTGRPQRTGGVQTRFNETVAANYDALETLRAVLDLPSMPRRIECFDISTIQGSETVASMVVCEDGRMKRAEYRKFRIRGPIDRERAGSRDPGSRTSIPGSSTTSHRCTKSSAPVSQGPRERRTVSRSDPDRWRARAAVGRLRGARGAGAGQSGRGRHRQEGRAAVHRATATSHSARRPTARRCCSSSAFATRRTGLR